MSAESLLILPEPSLEFRYGQSMSDPRDGLALFGPYDADAPAHPRSITYGLIGTKFAINTFHSWASALTRPILPEKEQNSTIWPIFPGFDAAFLTNWPSAAWQHELDEVELIDASRNLDAHKRTYAVVNKFIEGIEKASKRDESFALIICVVPDEIYKNCRPMSQIKMQDAVGHRLSSSEKRLRKKGQRNLFEQYEPEQYNLAIDFRRQIKARVMQYGIPIQIIRESTLRIGEIKSDRGLTPLSDRAWNLATTMYYKAGGKPWRLSTARDGVCYIGLAFRKADAKEGNGTACCAAQMFLDTGDGIVFMGEFGPWFSEKDKQFHLTKSAAKKLLEGVLKNYEQQGGKQLKEIFLHSRSDISDEEFAGYQEACPANIKLVAIRVRLERNGLKLFRDGTRPVLRGTCLKVNNKTAFLWASGFKPRLRTYDGWETPVPLKIDIQHGEADIEQVAKDIFGLTKLNYNCCKLGSSIPITIGFSDAVGEILISNPNVPSRKPSFKFYI